MPYEEKSKTIKRPHNLTMEERKRLTVSGVEDVASFDENEIALETTAGTLLIRGTGLKVGKVSIETGEMSIEGLVTDLVYQEVSPSGSLWTRLFR
jgi:sporulation protein YabP